ncbi:MAG: type II toxin-antitoxin system RelE/ParE family toxin [Burkholderia sp.]|nr:type II toxin-antitoxin system RelE/ParE family toxin [Burkholderia sp.]MCL4636486.1 type II toxin-antitoxin system RelE/ParE family toxin [Burkholderia sp.]
MTDGARAWWRARLLSDTCTDYTKFCIIQTFFRRSPSFSSAARWPISAAFRCLRDASGAFRIVYVATFTEAVYVLHCLRKQSTRTNKTDIDLAARRYRTLMMELKR